MTADHNGPGWWQPPRRRRGLLDCLPTVLLGAVVLVGLAALLTACGGAAAAVDAGFPLIRADRAVILDMPSGFADVATACNQGNRLYVSASDSGYNGSDVYVVAADPTCQGEP